MKVATGPGIALFAAIAAFFIFTTSEASHAGLNITGSDGKVVLADVDREKIPELVSLLGSPDYQVWKQAQEYLASFGPEAIPELLKALERGGAEEKILSTFYYIPDKRAVKSLAKYIADPSPEKSGAAMSALVAIGEPAVAELSGLLQDGNYGAAAAETLRSIKPGSASLETLRKLLSSEVPESRAWAANVLGSWRDKGSVEGLKKLARDKDRFVREKAVEAYWLTADEYDADLLLSLLKDESENVRLKAMTMLSKQPDKRAVDILLDIMKKGETLSERAAAMAAAGFSKDKSVITPFIVALADKDEIMVSQAIYFLGYQKADIASNDILSVIKNRVEVNDETIIQNAAYALVQFGKPVDDLSIFYRFLGKKWDHDTKREVLKLFGSLGKKGDQKLIEVVKKFKEGESEAGLLEMADEALMKLQ